MDFPYKKMLTCYFFYKIISLDKNDEIVLTFSIQMYFTSFNPIHFVALLPLTT